MIQNTSEGLRKVAPQKKLWSKSSCSSLGLKWGISPTKEGRRGCHRDVREHLRPGKRRVRQASPGDGSEAWQLLEWEPDDDTTMRLSSRPGTMAATITRLRRSTRRSKNRLLMFRDPHPPKKRRFRVTGDLGNLARRSDATCMDCDAIWER